MAEANLGYTLKYTIPYEGQVEMQFSTLDEVKSWLENHRSAYEHSLDNVSVYPTVHEINVYDLMAGVLTGQAGHAP
jgi:hypothetical protein